MSEATDGPTLDLDGEAAWVAHVALQRRAEHAFERGDTEVLERTADAIHAVEVGGRLSPTEARQLRAALVEYLADAPLRDRPVGRELLVEVGEQG